jgi:hypothetical protein
MIKLVELIGTPSLQYHIDNNLTLHENVYRYSSDSFIQLFAEARDAHRDGKIQLNEEDLKLIETTDIGLYGLFEGTKVPLDLPMIEESKYEKEETTQQTIDRLKARLDDPNDGMNVPFIVQKIKDLEKSLNEDNKISDDKLMRLIPKMPKGYVGKNTGIGKYTISTPDGEDIVLTQSKDKKNWSYEPSNVALKVLTEAEYKGKDVPLNKPKRGGSKKFFVYTKNKKGNVVKVSFGGTTGLSVKIKEPGARASFAARHKCATKKDKTKPGYWACNVGRYWKSLGGAKNFSGYW